MIKEVRIFNGKEYELNKQESIKLWQNLVVDEGILKRLRLNNYNYRVIKGKDGLFGDVLRLYIFDPYKEFRFNSDPLIEIEQSPESPCNICENDIHQGNSDCQKNCIFFKNFELILKKWEDTYKNSKKKSLFN